MACDLTIGRAKQTCKVMAGIKYAYFTLDALGVATMDATDTDMVTTWAGTVEWFKYDLHPDANNADLGTWTGDAQTGSGFFAQSLNIQLNKLDAKTHKEFKLLCYSNPFVVLETYEGDFFIMGLENGLDTTGGTVLVGGAPGDTAGYTLTMAGREKIPANFIDVTDLADAGAAFTVSASQIAP